MKFSYPKYVTHTHIVCIYTEVVACVSLTSNEGEDIVYGAKWTPQSPFTSVFMYISENPEYEKEVAMLIEEFLKQRIQGMKNRDGHYITQAFPKLLYCLDENNIHEDSKYYYLTELAAKCTAKRMVPDYISAKIMKQLKGDVYPCMGM